MASVTRHYCRNIKVLMKSMEAEDLQCQLERNSRADKNMVMYKANACFHQRRYYHDSNEECEENTFPV